MIRRQLTVAGDLDLETFYCKVNLFFSSFFFLFFSFFGGRGVVHPSPVPVGLRGSGASQLVCPKLSAVLIARYTGVE